MSDFVDRCRREWKRLGVPDPLADEMAADLAGDLHDAEAEGLSVEQFLGDSAVDPRSFAASWAGERGIIPPPPGEHARRGPRALTAFTLVAAFTLIVSAVLLITSEPRISLVASTPVPPHLPAAASGHVGRVVSASAATPIEWILLGFAIVALAFAGWLWRLRVRGQASVVGG